jgi:hypothetical protein
MPVERRGLTEACRVRSKESGLAKKPTTEAGQHTRTAEETVRESGLAERVSALRQKLGQKAKRESRFRFHVLYDRITGKTRWKRHGGACAPTRAQQA